MNFEPIVVSVFERDERLGNEICEALAAEGWQTALRTGLEGLPDLLLSTRSVHAPGCIVVDTTLISPLCDVSLIEQCKIPVLFTTAEPDLGRCVRAMRAGAVDFLLKPLERGHLLRSVRRALELDREARVKRAEVQELRTRYERLTPRERQVLPLVAAGMLNKQTAAELGTAEVTICVHRGQIMRKMGAGSLPELVRMTDKLHLQAVSVAQGEAVGVKWESQVA